MAKIFFDQDADLGFLNNRTIAIIGYGNQGQAQGLNLRDSGMQVIVGNISDASAGQAKADGFEVYPISEASKKADILFLLIPDEVLPKVYQEHIAPHLVPGQTLNFASGYNIAFNHITPPADVDVILVAPRMIGKGVRETFLRGTGFPSLLAVHQDASGNALQIALALAKGIGSTRMGAVMSSFKEEAVVDLFSEQSGDLYFPRMMFDVLVEAGFDPDVVLLELYASGELSEMYAAVRDMGLWGQLKLHSRTSQYGQQVTSRLFSDHEAVKDGLRQVVNHIRSGEFSQEWKREQQAGFDNLIKVTNENLQHPMQKAENRLYRLLGRREKDLETADWLEGTEE
jgi:ketol-acid reductoisomerase